MQEPTDNAENESPTQRHPASLRARKNVTTMNARNPAISAARYEVFFRELAIDGNISRATEVAGCDRSTIYQHRKNHPEFAQRWADAIETAVDSLEAEAHRRAVEGVDEPVYYKGIECGRIKRYSDPILLALLKRYRPEYRDHGRVEIANAPAETLMVEESPVAIARKIAFVLQLGLRAARVSGGGLGTAGPGTLAVGDGR